MYISGSFSFDFSTKIIELTSSATQVTCQEIINAIRKAEYDFEGMPNLKIANATGKDSLGGGISVGITIDLLNDWQLKFQSRAGPSFEQVTVKDGNLVGGLGGNPIAVSSFTQVKQIQSAAGTIATVSGSGTSSGPTALEIADAVWDELIPPAHTGSNSAGEFLYGAGGGSSPSAIASAVWSAQTSANQTAGSFGEKVGKKLLTFAKWIGLK
jgi:hypothetical protein